MTSFRSSNRVMWNFSGPVLYSHLLKWASEKSDDRAADLWVPDLNLPVADMLPADYAQSEAVRLEIYGRAARCGIADELDDLEEDILPSLRQAAARCARILCRCQAQD